MHRAHRTRQKVYRNPRRPAVLCIEPQESWSPRRNFWPIFRFEPRHLNLDIFFDSYRPPHCWASLVIVPQYFERASVPLLGSLGFSRSTTLPKTVVRTLRLGPEVHARTIRTMADHSPSSSGEGADPLEDEVPASAPVLGPHNQETLSAAAEELFLSNEASSPLAEPASGTSVIMNARAYQSEMLAESMRQNIVVAMDTGSGKTQVAVLRIRAEIERTSSKQIVWFLAPTVSLCNQQFEVLKTQIPEVQIKFLSGDDNVDSWSDQQVWDAVLLNVRIVVSTYQILLDALSHAFVPMSRLSLIVFDEAHNCVGKSPGAKIMSLFYHEEQRKGRPTPHILGLTASPTFGSKVESINTLEATLDAVCKSPTMHRDDLLAAVNKPELAYASFQPRHELDDPNSLRSLRTAIQSLDISEDPYVRYLQAEGTDRSRRDLISVLKSHDTYIQNQMTSFGRQANHISSELGPWAAEYYIWEVISRFRAAVRAQSVWFDTWKDEEKQYLFHILSQVECQCPSEDDLSREVVSDKVLVVIEKLLQDKPETIGIIFARERATVAVLCHLLTSHKLLRERYRIGAMMGTSQFQAKKKDIWDLSRVEDQRSLHQFRSGRTNLLVATSVLEEGIDVPACNLVLCFDNPPNLKSFIQRRGRARKKQSKLLMLFDRSKSLGKEWEMLEAEMKAQYEDQERELERLQEIEQADEPKEMIYRVQETGAVLDLDNAKQHLDHLCRILSPGEYIDWRPDYIIHETIIKGAPDLRATVNLPSYLPASVRSAESELAWKSEQNATKDAAFQAYVKLREAGLINDNLLPFKPEDFVPGIDKRAAILQVNGLLNAWNGVAKAWKVGNNLRATRILLKDSDGAVQGEYEMVIPVWVPGLRTIPIYLGYNVTWSLEFGQQLPIDELAGNDDTAVLLALPYGHRWNSAGLQQIVRFSAVGAGDLSLDQIGVKGFVPGAMSAHDLTCFIRDQSGSPYTYDNVIPNKPAPESVQKMFYEFEKAPEDVPYLALKKWSRRSDFLHRPQSDPSHGPSTVKPYNRVYPMPWAKVDNIPAKYAQFGVLIPSILHHIETHLVARELSMGILRPLAISDPSLVLTAISAGSACEPTNYERIEFLGDSILKFSATINVAALNPDWPERLLSFKKDAIVANSTLCKAAIKHGLDRFILTKPFTGQKWRPIYVDDMLQRGEETSTRKISTKTLADIVEALIGASMIDGGLPKALKCMSIFLQQIKWKTLDDCRQALYDVAPSDIELPSTLEPLEQLIGYEFEKKSLLIQSMTHASFNLGNTLGCLERLEFIGDSVLDYVIVNRLFTIEPPLPHQTMHLLKTAMVNGDFLGFLALEQSVSQDEVIVTGAGSSGKEPELHHSRFALPLWKFMRHQAPAIGLEQVNVSKRHTALRDEMIEAMEHGTTYPWALLARMQLRKFYSDVFESLLGAVYVDSGDLEVCAGVVERFGILEYLDRILRDEVHVLHPKEELGHLADNKTVTYVLDVQEVEDGEKRFSCKVMVGDRCVVEVDGGISRDEVKVKAAEAAVSILKAEKNEAKQESMDVQEAEDTVMG
ncbi:RNase3 domain-containing protein [Colletotrichum orchidophilum]|uniref:RNase3 domain-containing protein n=1 Tax=Colletotrichum orchidophilum TaxID=1209926 RepID=A0A1G4B836_9PEZI|nr:RNase3 domain-containing protein [Colletotrichum orchidophilum]OHE97620.1 RNase3 domain-containing protein [Colletotrichum orchidophilum]